MDEEDDEDKGVFGCGRHSVPVSGRPSRFLGSRFTPQ